MTIDLPTNPDIDQLRRQAEELLQQARSGDAAALDRLGTSAHSGAALSLGRRIEHPHSSTGTRPGLRQATADARGRIIGLRAAHPVFDDKTTGGDALFTHRATRRCPPRSTTVRRSVSRVSALERPP